MRNKAKFTFEILQKYGIIHIGYFVTIIKSGKFELKY